MHKSSSDTRCSFFKKSETPGPGSYEIPSKICEGPYYKIRGRINVKENLNNIKPGPGTYDLPEEKIPGGFVMGISLRTFPTPDNVKSNIPGPGTYSFPSETLGKPWKFHKVDSKPERPNTSLGPGSYEVPSTLLNKSFSFTGKSKTGIYKDQNCAPGPGAYDPQAALSRSGTFTMVSKRPEVKDNKVPGPGTYTVTLRPTTSSSTFGVGNRTELKNHLECNTSYDLPTTIGEGPKLSIGPKIKSRTQSEGPGPGAYNPEPVGKVPCYVFGVSSKTDLFDTKTRSPGPVYNVETSLNVPCHSFTWSRRHAQTIKDPYPGPGSYEKKSTLKESLITFKSRQKDFRFKYSSTIPGPGAYDHEQEKVEKGWSHGKASRKLEWTQKEKSEIKKKLEEKNHCKCMNPNLKYKKTH